MKRYLVVVLGGQRGEDVVGSYSQEEKALAQEHAESLSASCEKLSMEVRVVLREVKVKTPVQYRGGMACLEVE